MSSSELKSSLKEAKNAIKDKDYTTATKACKAALKVDRKNYQALVMFGRASQELGKYEDSKKVLLIATQVDSDCPIAWLGLSTLLDLQPDIGTLEESVTIYQRVADIAQEDDKIEAAYRKLANVYQKSGNITEAANVLKKLTTKLSSPKSSREIWILIADMLSGVTSLSDDNVHQLIEALENLLDTSIFGDNEKNYKLFLKLTYQTKQYNKVLIGAKSMAQIFTTLEPQEWIARIYSENCFHLDDTVEVPDDSYMEELTDKMLNKYQSSPWGNVARGCLLYKAGQLVEARNYIKLGAERLASNIIVWLMLIEVQEKSRDWSGVVTCCRKILGVLSKQPSTPLPSKYSLGTLQKFIILKEAKVLCNLGHVNHFKKAVEILEKEGDKDLETQTLLIKTRLGLGDVQKAYEEIELLLKECDSSPQILLIKAAILKASGESQQSMDLYEKIIKDYPDSSEGFLQLGKFYFELEKYEKTLVCCLKAAKIDPNCGNAFLYLGHYYKNEKNYDKARKCYEKAYKLNPLNDDIGVALSTMYRILDDHEANLSLLETITYQAGRSCCGWAWLCLGLHYMDVRDYDKAVFALQCASHINDDSSTTIECLGQAYLQRGSFSAALKVFDKAYNLNPENLYPLCQSALIKHITGDVLESIKDYEKILSLPQSLPKEIVTVSLVGLSETLLTDAQKNYLQLFHINVKTNCLRAMFALTKAASHQPRSVTIWKLLGDVCTLLHCLPPSISNCNVPHKLLDSSINNLEEQVEINLLQVLELGAKCYGVGLKISNEDCFIWHDLGVNFYFQANHLENSSGDSEKCEDLMSRALSSVKKSLALSPNNFKAWNSLGIIAASETVKNYELAQHCFITSIEYQSSATSWALLGTFYLQQNKPYLAHEAFSHAQCADPSYITAWIGQAIVAETLGDDQTFDLYRHTTILGIQVEGCYGFAHNLTKLAFDATEEEKKKNELKVTNFIPKANDCLVYYTRDKERDLIGLNMAGITLEILGLHQSAITVFRKADDLIKNSEPNELTTKLVDNIRCNFGRVLTAVDLLEEAVSQYQSIKETDIISQCGLALASVKAGKYEDAYNSYTSALHWLASDDAKKSKLLIALAHLQYKFQNIEEAKTLLFESSHLKDAAVEGILALASLGLITGDATLISAALAELSPHSDSTKYCHHIAFLQAAHQTVLGNVYDAKIILLKAIHKHPQNSSLWRHLSQHLLMFCRDSPSLSSSRALKCSGAATTLSQASKESDMVVIDSVSKVMAHLLRCKSKQVISKDCFKEAQRAVLMCPNSPEAWAMLATTIKEKYPNKAVELANIWTKKSNKTLAVWFKNMSQEVSSTA